jgi:anti-sigma-K factor RskA
MELYTIRFPEVTPAVANGYAERLQDCLRQFADDDVRIERRRSSSESMDFGSTIAVVVVTAIVKALVEKIAHQIANWSREQPSDTGFVVVEITAPCRSLRFASSDPQIASKIVQLFLECQAGEPK